MIAHPVIDFVPDQFAFDIKAYGINYESRTGVKIQNDKNPFIWFLYDADILHQLNRLFGRMYHMGAVQLFTGQQIARPAARKSKLALYCKKL